MSTQHDLPKTTVLAVDVDTSETIENCVKRLQATAAELFASLVQRAHLLDRDLDEPVAPQDSVTNDEARGVGRRLASTAYSLDAALDEIRGQLERVNSHLNSAPEPISDTYKVGHVNQSSVDKQE
ncbi:MAG: hypothetical protein ACYC1I_12185 [Acidimicrobiales bacterium]